jgi:ATP-dependent DNA helicase RecG
LDRTLPIDYESLQKILDLEKKKGYTDSAVIGGLDRYLQNWTPKAMESITSPQMLKLFKTLNLSKSNYVSLTINERKELIENILDILSDTAGNKTGRKIKAKPQSEVIKPPKTQKRTKKPTEQDTSIDTTITAIKGISTSMAAKFSKLDIKTIRDLLYFFPNRHLDYSQVKTISQLAEGKEETIIANVWQAQETRLGNRRSTEAIVGDETGNVRVVWFNNPYLAKQLVTNTRIIISGRVGLFKGRYVFESPEWELIEEQELIHAGRLVPVYPLTQGLRPRQVRKLMKTIVDQWAWRMVDFLPPGLVERQKFLELPQAISQAHFPDDELHKNRARTRLAFNELFLLQLGVLNKKRRWQEEEPGSPVATKTKVLDSFLKSLPFELTQAQNRVIDEILTDLNKQKAMSRLLQGEVGSGKTVVATAALLMAAANGYQGALMAPTEVLAEQHFSTICNLLSRVGNLETDNTHQRSYSGILSRPVTVSLLIGDISQARKRELQQSIKDGETDIVIGTHALIQKDVEFQSLVFAVVDEQHRFGVLQRSELRQKGFNPHLLVMTATPIPRTLALTLYGDLDLSVIDELPPGRQEIKTKWLKQSQRDSAYAFIKRQIGEGRQAFIICPLIEESEVVQARAAVAEYERLSELIFPELKLGLLHGRLSSADKDKVMRQFRTGELAILVATPVVEVGIDVPNANVMLVESADRFGLSQLHQFRGRVGRGQEQSYCMLLAQNPSEIGRERLDIIERTQDGFQLAEEDLKLRGPGEFFGTRQSGIPDLRMAKLSDVALLELARTEALMLFEKDKKLQKPEHSLLVKELARVWPEAGEWS